MSMCLVRFPLMSFFSMLMGPRLSTLMNISGGTERLFAKGKTVPSQIDSCTVEP